MRHFGPEARTALELGVEHLRSGSSWGEAYLAAVLSIAAGAGGDAGVLGGSARNEGATAAAVRWMLSHVDRESAALAILALAVYRSRGKSVADDRLYEWAAQCGQCDVHAEALLDLLAVLIGLQLVTVPDDTGALEALECAYAAEHGAPHALLGAVGMADGPALAAFDGRTAGRVLWPEDRAAVVRVLRLISSPADRLADDVLLHDRGDDHAAYHTSFGLLVGYTWSEVESFLRTAADADDADVRRARLRAESVAAILPAQLHQLGWLR